MGAKKTMIFAMAAAVIMTAVVLFALNYSRFNTEIPSVKLAEVSMPGSGDTVGTPGADEDNALQHVVIDTDNVQNVIATMSRTDSYHRVINTALLWENGSSLYTIETWVGQDKTRISVKQDGVDETKNILLLEDKLYVWYGSDRRHYTAPIGGSIGDTAHLADEFQMIATYEDVLALKKSDIANAGYVVLNDVQYIFVETREDELGNIERYYISIDTGLLEGAETVNDGQTVYRMTVQSTELTAPAPEIFAVPN